MPISPRRKLWLIPALGIMVGIVGVWAYRHRANIPSKRPDSLSTKYELWAIELEGTFHHAKCRGDFKGQYKLYVLFSGGLTPIIGNAPTESPALVTAEGSYVGQEEVLSPARTKKALLLPSPIAPVDAKLAASWYKNMAGSRLDMTIESTGALVNGYCAENNRVFPHQLTHLKLISMLAEPQSISGTWTMGQKQGDGVIQNVQGKFKMTWIAGGKSGRPIPGPFDLKFTLRDDKTVLIQWTPVPHATKYDVYFAKGAQISGAPDLKHTTTESAFIVLEIGQDLPQTVAVSATLDGIETAASTSLQVQAPAGKP